MQVWKHVLNLMQNTGALKYVTFRRNIWRPDPELSPQNLEIDAAIARGGSGLVYRGRNKDTNVQYAFKVSRQRSDRRKTRSGRTPAGDPSPTLTRSSNASIVDPKLMYPLSLGMKREREARTFLRYIKSGHKNVCNLEAWCEFDAQGSRMFLHVFELCDAGTLFELILTYQEKQTSPPETFIVSNFLLELLAAFRSPHLPHLSWHCILLSRTL